MFSTGPGTEAKGAYEGVRAWVCAEDSYVHSIEQYQMIFTANTG